MRKKGFILMSAAVVSLNVLCGFTFNNDIRQQPDKVTTKDESTLDEDLSSYDDEEDFDEDDFDEEEGLTFYVGEQVEAQSLVMDIEDMSAVTVTFEDGSETKTYSTAGSYTEKVIITDDSGEAETEEVSFEVVEDTEPPVFYGLKNQTVYVGGTIDYLKNVTADDNQDGDLTDKIVVDSSKVDLQEAGKYKVTYTVTDSAGNTASRTIKITVKKDEAPVLVGVKKKSVYVNGKINYLKGVQAIDKKDGKLTDKIVVDSSKVDLTKAGTYQVTYSVTDSSGNTTTKTITVLVKQKKAASNASNKKSESKNKKGSNKKSSSSQSNAAENEDSND